MLALDLGVFHRHAHAVRPREALAWSIVWVTLALLFNVWIYLDAGREVALEFLTGYLLEKSLSVDNIFVIVMIFAFFRVPAALQHRVLFWGVMGALVLRGTFIGLGAYVLHRWHWVFYVFGALLVVTGLKMMFKKEEETDLSENAVIRLARRLIPITRGYRGNRFLVREEGRWVVTPLLLVVLLVEFSDLLFAIDSIPAIFAITDDTFIVYTSNVFAILGLRSMFFLLAAVVDRFTYLKYGLALVLMFIGVKMLIADFYKLSTGVSLLVLASLIAGSVAASLLFAPRTPPRELAPDLPPEDLVLPGQALPPDDVLPPDGRPGSNAAA
jgi:tellurite resistance protein TerC